MKRRFTDAELDAVRDDAANVIHFYAVTHPEIRGPQRNATLQLAENVMKLENEVRYPPTLWNRIRRKLGVLP